MPTTKKVRVRKAVKRTNNAAKSKVNVIVNVNSGNRKKVIGRAKSTSAMMPSVAPPPVIIPPSITSPPAAHNSLTDGHVQYLHHLTSSMVNLLRQPQAQTTVAPQPAFTSPEPVQGNLAKPTDDLPEPLKPEIPVDVKKEWVDPATETRGRSLFTRGATRSETPPHRRVASSPSSSSPPARSPTQTPRPHNKAAYIRHFASDYGITGLQNFNMDQLQRVFNASNKAAEADAIKLQRKRA